MVTNVNIINIDYLNIGNLHNNKIIVQHILSQTIFYFAINQQYI